jgi:hypothetical protein
VWNLERHTLRRKGALGTDDPLRDCGFGRQKRPRDFVGVEPAEQPQRERNPGVRRQDRSRTSPTSSSIAAAGSGALCSCVSASS